MRWRAMKAPAYGETRRVRRFAWFPTLVDEDTDPPLRVWLEWYWEHQQLTLSGFDGTEWRVLGRYSE
jgi:hypothetical protein